MSRPQAYGTEAPASKTSRLTPFSAAIQLKKTFSSVRYLTASHAYITAAKHEMHAVVGEPLVDRLLAGSDACCLAYGQAGAGKTHTMYGSMLATATAAVEAAAAGDQQMTLRGLVPRAFEKLFRDINDMQVCGYHHACLSTWQAYCPRLVTCAHCRTRPQHTVSIASIAHCCWRAPVNSAHGLPRSLAKSMHACLSGRCPRIASGLEESNATAVQEPNATYTVSASYLEVHNEQLMDLLDPGHKRLALRFDAGDGVQVENLSQEVVASGAPHAHACLQWPW
jgi:hypothetical protein